MKQHIDGTDLSDALIVLQQLVDTGASGSLKSPVGFLRLRRGRVVKIGGALLSGLVNGLDAAWGWRTVPGEPNGELDASLTSLLLQAA